MVGQPATHYTEVLPHTKTAYLVNYIKAGYFFFSEATIIIANPAVTIVNNALVRITFCTSETR